MVKKQKKSWGWGWGWGFFSLWAVLILAGIIEKRIFQHPDLMVFYHLPAAVCLVIAWYLLSEKVRSRYKKEVLKRGL